jgi:putative membrane protein
VSLPVWHPHPDVWLLIAVLAGGYVWAVRRVGPRVVNPVERVVTRRQIAAYSAGIVALLVAADWPVHDLAEGYLYSVHMVQHLLFSLVAAPLLLVGTPAWLLRWLLRPAPVLRAVRFLTRPLIALVCFNVVIAVSHIPSVVALVARSEPAHFVAHALLFLTALQMWTPVLSRLLELPSLSHPGKMLYLFLQSLVPTVPASFLTFGHTVLYHSYERAPRIFGISALDDQLVAGLLMKLGGGFLLWGVIGWYFFKWAAMEEREGVDVMAWRALDRDLARTKIGSR